MKDKQQPSINLGLSVDLNTGKINTQVGFSSTKIYHDTGKIATSTIKINHTESKFNIEACREKFNPTDNTSKIASIKLDHTGRPNIMFSQIKPNYQVNLKLDTNNKNPEFNLKFNQ